jgi:hypothetical protein
MIGLKLVRETNKPQRDNLVDIAGYARVLEMTQDSKMGLNEIAKSFVITANGIERVSGFEDREDPEVASYSTKKSDVQKVETVYTPSQTNDCLGAKVKQ